MGSLIIYHKENTNEILLGKEGNYIWNEKPLTPVHLNAQRIHYARIDLRDFKVRENLTKEVVNKVAAQLAKENPSGVKFKWLVPPVVKSSVQKNAPQGQITYSSHARKERDYTGYGPPKGGAEHSESRLETIIREIKEEIGDLNNDILPIIDDKYDKTVDINTSDGNKTYTIFYKKVTHEQARKIEEEIERRYALHIGEMFDLKFRDKNDGNSFTQEVLRKIQEEDKEKADKAAEEAARKAKPKENVRTAGPAQTGPAQTGPAQTGPMKPGQGWGKGKARGGKRYTKKQRKYKKTKKHTRRR